MHSLGRQTFLGHNIKTLIYKKQTDQVDLIRIKVFFVNQGFDIMSKKCLPTQRTQRFSSQNFCLTKFFQLIFVYGRRKEIFHPDILVF